MTNDRVWLITGCSSGFGQEIVRAALGRGDRVVATARRPEALAGLVAEGADRVRAVALDVTDPASVRAAVAAGRAAFGRIDVVVNNAGHGSVGAVEELTTAELRSIMDVMFFGAVEVTKAVLPQLRAQRGGTIVQLSSMGGRLSRAGFGAYSAAKFALEGLSEALAAEVAPFGVRVLIVEPGAFRTGFGGARMHRSAVIDDYEVSVRGTRDAVDGMDGRQPGDPRRAAEAIVHAVTADEAPLRLPLGRDAVDAIRTHDEGLLADLARWESLSAATDLARPR